MKKLKIIFLIMLITSGAVFAKANQVPKIFEYYVRPGDVISVCRFPDIQKEVQLKVKSIKWNEAVLEVVE